MSNFSNLLFAGLLQGILYLGPETIMPLASIIAAIVGFLLLFWRSIARFFKKVFRKGGNSVEDITPYVEPEDDEIRPS